MELFGGVIPVTGITFLMFCLFAILFLGYALGRITIKGVSLGDAGVFIVALLFGGLFFTSLDGQLQISTNLKELILSADIQEGLKTAGLSVATNSNNEFVMSTGFIDKALSIIETFGLMLFVTSVGFIAGPKFFGNLKKNFKSYVFLGLVIIIAGGLGALLCIALGHFTPLGYGAATDTLEGFVAMIVGLLSGSLTSTPAFGAAKDTVSVAYEGLVTTGHGIAYIFGVLGVVLFVQIVPKMMKADMAAERAKISVSGDEGEKKSVLKLLHLDHMGVAAFSLAAIIGLIVGQINIPLTSAGLEGTCFSLTKTGGCLLVALVLGHFGRIGKISLMPEASTLKLFRELGLVLFLMGAGIPGGADFVKNFDPMYFVYGIIMTLVPLIIGFAIAKWVLKMPLLNNLGSITGGMTSTPALGTLIGVAGTEDVAAAYAATYPVALIAVVLVSQLLIIFIK